MHQESDPPYIRVGLIGLPASGKTHFVATLNKAFWGLGQDTQIIPLNDATIALFRRANEFLRINTIPLPPSQSGTHELYSVLLKRAPAFGKMGGFEHKMDILDVDGEQIKHHTSVYADWFVHCNALVFLIDGAQLLESDLGRRDNFHRREHIVLLEHVKNLLMLRLRNTHKGKRKIFLAFCVTKYDLFEAEQIDPESLVKQRLAPIYELVDQISELERSWIEVRWYGLSALGYVWDDRGHAYVDMEGREVQPGKRVSQLYRENDQERLHETIFLRPEGLVELIEDMREHVKRQNWRLLPLHLDLKDHSNDSVEQNAQEERSVGRKKATDTNKLEGKLRDQDDHSDRDDGGSE